jgi:hypothetical protein
MAINVNRAEKSFPARVIIRAPVESRRKSHLPSIDFVPWWDNLLWGFSRVTYSFIAGIIVYQAARSFVSFSETSSPTYCVMAAPQDARVATIKLYPSRTKSSVIGSRGYRHVLL